MAEYIKREALREILDGWRDAHADVDDVHGCGLLEDVICELDAQTAADVAPIEALERLRDDLCAQDQITMEGLRKLNTLIGKYTMVYDGGAEHEAD